MSFLLTLPPFDYFAHLQACNAKQLTRAELLSSPVLSTPLSPTDREILSLPVSTLASKVRSGVLNRSSVLRAYAKAAKRSHDRTNCLTEVLFRVDPTTEEVYLNGDERRKEKEREDGPLAGVPISLKDTIMVKGTDTTVGYSKYVGLEEVDDGSMVKLLREAGAMPFVKTNLPITLLSFESTNDVWGRCKNPHNALFSPGGSSGGESALLACGGSRIGIGSDVAGSVRLPAHWAGCYALRCSTGRWPKAGIRTSMAGQEGVPSVYSPMARTLEDLRYFAKTCIQMKPWRYDGTVHPLDWRENVEKEWDEKKVMKVGIMWDDGVVSPSPACTRALKIVQSALVDNGHTVRQVSPPSPYEALQIASQLLNADGCTVFSEPFRTFEWTDLGAWNLWIYMRLPRFLRKLHYLFVKYVLRDPLWAGLLRDFRPRTAEENWKLVIRREAYRARWHEWWNTQEIDILLTVPNATPALPHDAMHDAVSSCGYTFLFNLLDYTSGVMPVTKVDAIKDALPAGFKVCKLNGVARGAYKHYDSKKMTGLPVGVQVIGRRLEEEKVLGAMGRIENMLSEKGEKYEPLDVLD